MLYPCQPTYIHSAIKHICDVTTCRNCNDADGIYMAYVTEYLLTLIQQ